MTRRLLAEHEAAHAVVAAHYGQQVDTIRVGRADGETRYQCTATPREQAAITAAGDLFNREFGTVSYQDFGCRDLADMEREHGLGGLWRANRDAREILASQRQLVLDLADRLMHTPVLHLG
jgi:hypothetical protein